MQYIPYKIGSFCTHDSSKSKNNYVDLICNERQTLIHRVSQFGRFCNKCAAIITKSVSNLQQCLCCTQKLEDYLADRHLCQHSNRTMDEIMIKCLDNKEELHEIPFKSKVCEQCFSKIRAAFMFSQKCVVCDERQEEIFENLQKTLTLPAHHFYQMAVELCYKKKFSDEEIKKQIESYCLAQPRVQYKSKISSQIPQISENIESYHQSKRYQLYPKCQKHRNSPISVCNNCLVSILNIERCPYGCAYQSKEKNKAKVENVKVSEAGFVSLYPKVYKNTQYLQLFVIRLVDEVNRLVRWESSLKKVRLSEECQMNLKQLFTLYGSSIQLSPDQYLFTGGAKGPHIFKMKPVSQSFIIEFSKNRKQFKVRSACSMNEERCSHSLVKAENYIYAIGGYNTDTKKCLNNCERYDISKDKWQKIAPLKVQRSKPISIYHNNSIYVFGGLTSNQQIANSYGEMYNITKKQWESMNFQGYDFPFLTGATALNSLHEMPSLSNIILFGGSNYQNMTCLVQELSIKNNSFRMNPNPLLHKFKNSREGASLAIMNNSKDSQKTVIVFGGGEEFQPFLTFDALRIKLEKREGKTEVSPFFVFDEIQTGSYRLLLRDNAMKTYEYMFETLVEQKIMDKQKLQKGVDQIFKSEFNVHMIEKMWYGIGKSMINISL